MKNHVTIMAWKMAMPSTLLCNICLLNTNRKKYICLQAGPIFVLEKVYCHASQNSVILKWIKTTAVFVRFCRFMKSIMEYYGVL